MELSVGQTYNTDNQKNTIHKEFDQFSNFN